MQIFEKRQNLPPGAEYNINTAEVFVLNMNLHALQLLKQAETFNNSQSWKFYISSWKHIPIFIRKNASFFF